MNAVEIEAAISELALAPFDAAEFPFDFLAAFGNKDTSLKRLRSGNSNASDVAGGVLLHNHIHLAVCRPGAASGTVSSTISSTISSTVSETLKALRASPATVKAKAKFILATNGQTLEAQECVQGGGGETINCAYADFPNHFGFFLPLAGISTLQEIKDNPIGETQLFFAETQNKLLFAAAGHTAAELIVKRADAQSPNRSLTHWSGGHLQAAQPEPHAAGDHLSPLVWSSPNRLDHQRAFRSAREAPGMVFGAAARD